MGQGFFRTRTPQNEVVKQYLPGSPERASLKAKLQELKGQVLEIPLIIGGKEVRTGRVKEFVMPHNHRHVLARYHVAGPEEIQAAIEAALEAKTAWGEMPWEHRASIFLKAAELLSGPWRDTLNAATMLGQSKTVVQAEIDSACELIDFLRFNVKFAEEIYEEQPMSATSSTWNRTEYRPLEGFVAAITPFNFTAIGGNLSTAPAMMGNTVLWKPATTALYSNYLFMKLLEEAGLPPGVINFIPSQGREFGDVVLKHPALAGIHFTGSTEVFETLWKQVGDNIHLYHGYPRLVGETGGKDFVFAHASADVEALVTALILGAFEYQGQKCSAASRAYIPESLWPQVKALLVERVKALTVGDPEDFRNFMGAVIDRNSFNNIKSYITYAQEAEDAEILVGGTVQDEIGYFVDPTIIVTKNSYFKTMVEEIFGPILTIYVYRDEDFEATLRLCNDTSPYGLTGAVFAQDRNALALMERALRDAAGNFYLNDKPTGAVVGQQPFGGGRKSGTNDKAGSKLNLLRWVSPRTLKENFYPPRNHIYPYMVES